MYVLATCSTEFDFINCKNTYHTYSTKLHILKIYSELQKKCSSDRLQISRAIISRSKKAT